MALLRFSLISFAVIILDQLSKFLVKKFGMSFTTNTGAAFGILKGMNLFFIIFTLVAIFFILFYYKKIIKEKYSEIGFALILGGAVGNLIDRISFGAVVDFIDIGFWPSFNVADSCISIGVIGLIVYYWKK